jgi:pimeloyl-ACP methyl ester carboxylesterase
MRKSAFHPFRSEQAREEYHALYMERARAWPVASETKLIDTPTGQTFVRMSGRITDPPLVLLPGSKATSLTWIPNIAALSSRYRTYALDSIYDFGLSVRRKKIKTPGDLVTWLDEVSATLIPDGKFSLVGLSYGGWLAGQYALHFPDRIESVVLLAPALTILPVSPALLLRATLTLIPLPGFRRQFYYWLLNDSVRNGDTGRAFVDEAVADWAVAERCFTSMPLIPANVLTDKEMKSFKVPCLFMVGENEKMYSTQKAVDRLHRTAPQIKTEIIPQAGHDLTFVQTELVNRIILDFLAHPEI